MTLKKCILTRNDCYQKGAKMDGGKPTGIVVHSTGANNPNIKRYVQPLKADADYAEIIADIGVNQFKNSWNVSYRAGETTRQVCVHAFIGKNASGKVETYQTLPFDICCWGCANGRNGSYNRNPTARVQFEICEDGLSDRSYFDAAFKEAAEFCAYLCKTYGFGVDKICSHHESYLAGYGNNHGDPDHWMKRFGLDMDWFRGEVQKMLGADDARETNKKDDAHDAIAVGDLVKIVSGATYYSGKEIPTWVLNQNWYVKRVGGDRVVIDQSEDGKLSITSPVSAKYLKVLKKSNSNVQSGTVTQTTNKTNDESTIEHDVWEFLMRTFDNAFGVAGLMGNLKAESSLRPTNLQNTYEKSLGMTDAAYTEAVDNGIYTNFVHDSAGYGLAQWTHYSRKQNLLDYAKSKGASIGDLGMQLEFLVKELKAYSGVYATLLNATSVKEASDIVMVKYERPANQSDANKEKRAAYGLAYYERFANETYEQENQAGDKTLENGVIVTGSTVNIRKGPQTTYDVVGVVQKGDVLEKIEFDGWVPVDVDGEIRWISGEYVK